MAKGLNNKSQPKVAKSRAADETLEERIDFLITLSGGTMPVSMLVKTEAEAVEARRLIKLKKSTVLTVRVGD